MAAKKKKRSRKKNNAPKKCVLCSQTRAMHDSKKCPAFIAST